MPEEKPSPQSVSFKIWFKIETDPSGPGNEKQEIHVYVGVLLQRTGKNSIIAMCA